MSTPGTKWTASEVDTVEEEEVLEGKSRALAARGNYACQDRLGIMYAAKELSRDMPGPKETNCKAR